MREIGKDTRETKTAEVTDASAIVGAAGDVVEMLRNEIGRFEKKLGICIQVNVKLLSNQEEIIKLLDFLAITMQERQTAMIGATNKLCREHMATDIVMIDKIKKTKKIIVQENTT
jgi:hypothetical protein